MRQYRTVLVLFRLLPQGFRNRDLRQHLALLLDRHPDSLTPGQMTHQLRRLRLHGLIQRIPRSHRYSVTDLGFRFAFSHVRLHAQILRPALADIATASSHVPGPLLKRFAKMEAALDQWLHLATRSAA